MTTAVPPLPSGPVPSPPSPSDPAGTAFALDAFLAREQSRVEGAMATVAAEVAADAHPALREPLAYALGTRGKRLRPILCAAAWRAVAGTEPGEDVYRLACAVELVHTYSLVHDDLPCMDDDDLRRGRPTTHRAHGVAAAVLAGAALIPAAAAVLDGAARALGLDAAARGVLVRELCAAAGARGMVGGQLRDLEGEAGGVDAEGLERIHRGKTGALLAASLRAGARAAGADDARREALTTYGRELGLAFQIVDDVLDATSTPEALGKSAGIDAALGKSTYVAFFGVDGARARAGARVAAARGALEAAGVRAPELEALARFVLERRA